MKCQRCGRPLPDASDADCHDEEYWDEHLAAVLTGAEYEEPDTQRRPTATCIIWYIYHEARFNVLVAGPDDTAARTRFIPPGYDFSQSLEGPVLNKRDDLYAKRFETKSEAIRRRTLERGFATCVAVAAFPLMQRLAPGPAPQPRTLQERLYPPTFALQALTADGTLVCREIGAIPGLPDRHLPVQEVKLRAAGIDLAAPDVPVVNASQVVLSGCWRSLVWLVSVGGKTLVCKTSRNDVWEHTLGLELETYRKLGAAHAELRVPQLRGIVTSHTGVIGILLGYIPHSHRNLRTLLKGVRAGTTPKEAASLALRHKWAEQIMHTVAGLHELGVLWGAAKLDNAVIDDQDDAVVLGFGGGNTKGWEDRSEQDVRDREERGLRVILDALVLAN